jgi:RNA polymerase sigma factor for flagellar operon FliA
MQSQETFRHRAGFDLGETMLTATTFHENHLDAQPTPAILDRNKVVEQYAYLIKKVAYKTIARLPANVEMDDLMSAGVIGLIDAAEKYDPEKSCNFKSYAEIRIRGAMVDELRSLDWVPRSVRQKGASIDVVARELQGKLGRPATELEVATEMGLTLDEFHALTDKARAVSVVSFEDLGVGGADDKRDFLDSVGDPEALDPAQNTEVNDERDQMMRAIQMLPERQRVVLSLYYFEDMNLKEIGSLLGVTESRISQIHSAAVLQLRPILEELMAG